MIRIIHADVIDGLAQIPDQSVQCVVTSPPYWGLRDYGVDGQIGLEKTPEEFIAKMVEVFRGVRRVLRDDGTVWLNLGDCYTPQSSHKAVNTERGGNFNQRSRALKDVLELPSYGKPKDLVGIPWRVAFALQADGWYLRSDIIWSKPNPMPESVTDRPTKSHEYIFLLTKKARYYYDADAVREAHEPATIERAKNPKTSNPSWHTVPGTEKRWNVEERKLNPAGRNRRTVWEIATQPFPEAHFATFPEALVEPCIKAGTSERGCCSVCGAPWVRVVEKEIPEIRGSEHRSDGYLTPSKIARFKNDEIPKINTIGWQPSCSCNADTVPCIVLDPFGGSGTVGKVARDLKRKAILIELNAEYIKIAKERLRLNEQLGAFA